MFTKTSNKPIFRLYKKCEKEETNRYDKTGVRNVQVMAVTQVAVVCLKSHKGVCRTEIISD